MSVTGKEQLPKRDETIVVQGRVKEVVGSDGKVKVEIDPRATLKAAITEMRKELRIPTAKTRTFVITE